MWDFSLRVHYMMTVIPISSYVSKDSSVLIVMWFLYSCFNLYPIQTKLFPRVLLWLINKFIVPSYLRF